MMEHDRWAKYFATCKGLNASRTDKDFTVLLQRCGFLCQYGTIFSLTQSQREKKKKTLWLNQFLV